MALSRLQFAVLSTIIITAAKIIITHEIRRGAWMAVDPIMEIYTNAVLATKALNRTLMDPSQAKYTNITFDNGSLMVNGTIVDMDDDDDIETASDFYLSLSWTMLTWLLVLPLRYHWNICLERVFPARRSSMPASYQSETKVKAFDDNDSREEEAVRRWIAQGKVRRPSLSWTNTFFKWVLDTTVGEILFQGIFLLLHGSIAVKGFWDALAHLKGNILTAWILFIFSTAPLASLIGFIVVPAHLRLVFSAGASFTESVFMAMFLKLIVPWIMNQEFVKEGVSGLSGEMRKMIENRFNDTQVMDEL